MSRSADAVADLRAWIAENGWESYDPYDVRGTRPFIALQRFGRTRVRRVPLRLATSAVQAFPRRSRELLGVRPAANAHALAGCLVVNALFALGTYA